MKLHHLWGFACAGIVIGVVCSGCSNKQPEQTTPEKPVFKVTCWSGIDVMYQKEAVYATSSDGGLYVRLSDGGVEAGQIKPFEGNYGI